METDNIAVSILKARLFAGLTQKQVAEAIDKSQTTVAAWETGRSQPDAKTIIFLSELFHVSSDFLLGLSDFHNDNSKTFLDALLGEKSTALPEATINRFSDLMAELVQLFNLLNEVDIDLLPYAVDCLISLLHTIKDLSKTFANYEKMYSIYYTSTNLIANLNSTTDNVRKKFLDSDYFKEFFEIIAEFCDSMKDVSPDSFTCEIFDKVEKSTEPMAQYALRLQNEIFNYDKFIKKEKNIQNEK